MMYQGIKQTKISVYWGLNFGSEGGIQYINYNTYSMFKGDKCHEKKLQILQHHKEVRNGGVGSFSIKLGGQGRLY